MDNKFQYNYQAPNDLYLVVDDTYEYIILQYLIQLQNGFGKVFASIETLRLNKMSRSTAIKSIDNLEIKGFISRKISPSFSGHIANEYSVNYEVISSSILRALPSKELDKKARKELTEQQKDIMAKRRVVSNPNLMKDIVELDKYNKEIEHENGTENN